MTETAVARFAGPRMEGHLTIAPAAAWDGRAVPAVLLAGLPSLVGALGAVPDCRRARGRRYGQASALAFAVCGMAAGCRSLYALGFRRGTTPSVATLFRIFRDVDRAAFETALAGWADGQGVPAAADAAPGTLLGLHAEHLPGVETSARCGCHFGVAGRTGWRVVPFA